MLSFCRLTCRKSTGKRSRGLAIFLLVVYIPLHHPCTCHGSVAINGLPNGQNDKEAGTSIVGRSGNTLIDARIGLPHVGSTPRKKTWTPMLNRNTNGEGANLGFGNGSAFQRSGGTIASRRGKSMDRCQRRSRDNVFRHEKVQISTRRNEKGRRARFQRCCAAVSMEQMISTRREFRVEH